MEMAAGEIQCFLCNGTGKILKSQLLKDLGQLTDVAKMGVQETLDMLNRDGLKLFETVKMELTKSYNERWTEHLAGEGRRQEDERRKNQEERMAFVLKVKALEEELIRARATSVKKGEAGEVDFVAFMQGRRNLKLSEKLPKRGDYLLSVQNEHPDGSITWLNNIALIDVKKDRPIGLAEVDALAGDALDRKVKIGFLVTTRQDQLRGKDSVAVMEEKNGVFVVTVFMDDLPSFVDLLLPFMRLLGAQRVDEADETWRAKYAKVAQEVAQALGHVQGILEHTRSIREQADKVDKVVKKVQDRLQVYCALAGEAA